MFDFLSLRSRDKEKKKPPQRHPLIETKTGKKKDQVYFHGHAGFLHGYGVLVVLMIPKLHLSARTDAWQGAAGVYHPFMSAMQITQAFTWSGGVELTAKQQRKDLVSQSMF